MFQRTQSSLYKIKIVGLTAGFYLVSQFCFLVVFGGEVLFRCGHQWAIGVIEHAFLSGHFGPQNAHLDHSHRYILSEVFTVLDGGSSAGSIAIEREESDGTLFHHFTVISDGPRDLSQLDLPTTHYQKC